jgi:hypothetical protein
MNVHAGTAANTVSFKMRPKKILQMAFNQVLLILPAVLMAWMLVTREKDWGSERYLFIFLDICLFLLVAAGVYSIFRARLSFTPQGVDFRSLRNIHADWSEAITLEEEKGETYLLVEQKGANGQPFRTRIPLSWFGEINLKQKSSPDPLVKSLRGFVPRLFER